MDDFQPVPTDTETGPANKPGLSHKSLGLRILLADVDDIKQRDVEALMRNVNKQKAGESQPEAEGALLRAALMCGTRWIKEIEPALDPKAVDDLSPAKVRWFVRHINKLYSDAVTIPLV